MANKPILLGEAIEALRTEIEAAVAAAAGKDIQFELGPIEMEFQTVATREGGVNAKVSFRILGVGAELGGDGKLTSAHTQRVKFLLNPMQEPAEGGSEKLKVKRVPGR
ncbi:trypco2 family protein [Limobrevibacterium gyesilva]|uniref:Trypsin-co-occurring domain-containing protein n=1 Tax=Limobrevibacterium gyesilva TaxID=2991712 RepID=A0AA42CCY6_9PROT|nr:trypco2 family protein [Limobrevibacterium gyesilva]MCW3474183.1 hypothetical protein [Limobrevibacterium gyesilva]